MLYEGKAKRVYKTDNPKEYIVSYKDDATAFNGEKKGTISEKGCVNNQMSAILFEKLEKVGVPTHHIELLNERDSLVKAVKIIPLEVIIRNVAAGSMSRRYGIAEGSELKQSILEFSYKDDDLGDPMITESHIYAMDLATVEEVERVKELANQVNVFLLDYFKERGIKLIDFKLEFGVCEEGIVLADEISPDTCRLWDEKTNKKLDKDRFRFDMGDVESVYQEVFGRMTK